MKQQDFENSYTETWTRLEEFIDEYRDEKKTPPPEFPQLYTSACAHLSMARKRQYSQRIIDRLNTMVMAGHHILYEGDKKVRFSKLINLLAIFPAALRQNRVFIGWAAAIFLVPGVLMGLACYFNESLIYSLIPPETVRGMESMYNPANETMGRERDAGTDAYMFGFYIYNNIGIAFRMFAGGILFGLGSVFFLFYNGIYIGAIAGRLTQAGFSETFYPFVIGHGAFELTALVFAGGAGLKIGASLIAPGSLTRLYALKTAAREAVVILYGAAAMLLLAAFLEAYWSSTTSMPIELKLGVGAAFWLLVFWYCFFSRFGASRESRIISD